MTLSEDDTNHFLFSSDSKKGKATNDPDSIDDTNQNNVDGKYCESIHLHDFDLSTKKINDNNGKRKVSTTEFEVKYHLNDTSILKCMLCRFFVNDDMIPNNENVHFVAYGLLQYTSYVLYRAHIIKHNIFLYNLYPSFQ